MIKCQKKKLFNFCGKDVQIIFVFECSISRSEHCSIFYIIFWRDQGIGYKMGNWIKKTNKIILFTINMCKMGDWRGGTKIVIIWMKVLSKTYKTGRETWMQTYGKHVTMLNIKLPKVIYFRQKLMMNILNLIYV